MRALYDAFLPIDFDAEGKSIFNIRNTAEVDLYNQFADYKSDILSGFLFEASTIPHLFENAAQREIQAEKLGLNTSSPTAFVESLQNHSTEIYRVVFDILSEQGLYIKMLNKRES